MSVVVVVSLIHRKDWFSKLVRICCSELVRAELLCAQLSSVRSL